MTTPGLWRPEYDAVGKRPWYLCRDADNVGHRFHYAKDGWRLVRYASHDADRRAADQLNTEGGAS